DEPGIGHLDSLLAANDSLFLADVSSDGSMDSGALSGVIYQIKAISQSSKPPSKKQPVLSITTAVVDDLFATLPSRATSSNANLTTGRYDITSLGSPFGCRFTVTLNNGNERAKRPGVGPGSKREVARDEEKAHRPVAGEVSGWSGLGNDWPRWLG